MGVFKAKENQSLLEIYNHVISTYDLDRSLLRITCSRIREDEFPNIRKFADIKEKLREVRKSVILIYL